MAKFEQGLSSHKDLREARSLKSQQPAKQSEFLKTALKLKDATQELRSDRQASEQAVVEKVQDAVTGEVISELLQQDNLKQLVGEQAVKDLLHSQRLNVPIKPATCQALIAGDLLGKLAESAAKLRDPPKQPSRSRSKRRLDPRHPDNDYRNLEGLRPAGRPRVAPPDAEVLAEDRPQAPRLHASQQPSNPRLQSLYTRASDKSRILEAMRVLSKNPPEVK